MAWTDITNAQVGVSAPLNTALMTALRDNVGELAAGAVGAPVVNIQALGKFTAGTTRRYYDSTTHSTTSSFFVTEYSQDFWGSGVLRLTFEATKGTGTATNTLLVRVNGVTIHTETPSATVFETFTYDITLALGDTLSIQQKAGTATAQIRNIELLTNGEQVLPYGGNLDWYVLT